MSINDSWKENAQEEKDGSGKLLVPPAGSILRRRSSRGESGSDRRRSPSLNKRVTFFHSHSASTRSQAIRIHNHRRPHARGENGADAALLPNGPERPDSINFSRHPRKRADGESSKNHRRRGARSFADARSQGPALCTKRLADTLRRRTIKHRRCFRFLWPVKFLLFNRQRGQQGKAGSRSSRFSLASTTVESLTTPPSAGE